MLATVEQLEDSIDQMASQVAGVDSEDLDRAEAADALVRLERCRERLDAAIGGYTSDLDVRGFHESPKHQPRSTRGRSPRAMFGYWPGG